MDMEATTALTEISTGRDSANKVQEKNDSVQNEMNRKFGSKKYAALRNLSEDLPIKDVTQERVSPSLTSDVNNSQNTGLASSLSPSSSVLALKWESVMHGFQSFRYNVDSKGFLPLTNAQGSTLNSKSSFESLDDIFERLKHPPPEYRDSSD